jgi:uncharacterized protein YbjT (DUF2867 family)
MKLLVLGATGRTGRPLVEQALAAGHDVVALVRNPNKLTIQHAKLRVIQGDTQDANAVTNAAQGVDAILSTVGPSKGGAKDLMTQTARNVVGTARQHKVGRIVWLTGAGIGDPQDQPKFIDRLIVLLLKLLDGATLEDSIAAAQIIKGSGLAWIIVRGPRLTEGPKQGRYGVSYVGPQSGTQIARADVADFMLKALTDDTWLHKAPVVYAQ